MNPSGNDDIMASVYMLIMVLASIAADSLLGPEKIEYILGCPVLFALQSIQFTTFLSMVNQLCGFILWC